MEEINKIEVTEDEKKEISLILTPSGLLQNEDYEKPLIIHPKHFVQFEDLVEHRDKIKMLELVPIKDDDMHEKYGSMDQNHLDFMVETFLKDSPVSIAPNEFQYWLSSDVKQYLVWARHNATNEEIVTFITKVSKHLGVHPSEIVTFERPKKTDSILVKGTFPNVRHIHIWIKDKNHE